MRIKQNGFFRIVSTTSNLEFSLDNMECNSFNGDDYLETIDFYYADIFECVLRNIEWDTENLPNGINLSEYPIPTNKEEFYQSRLWLDLGFKVDDEFKFVAFIKLVEINHDMSYGQGALSVVDFEGERVLNDAVWMVRNALDDFIFEWSNLYFIDDNNEFSEIGGWEILDDLVEIYRQYNNENLEERVREKITNLYHNPDINSKISEEEIANIVQIMTE